MGVWYVGQNLGWSARSIDITTKRSSLVVNILGIDVYIYCFGHSYEQPQHNTRLMIVSSLIVIAQLENMWEISSKLWRILLLINLIKINCYMDTTYSNVYAPPDFKRSFLYAVCIPVCSVGLIDIAVERSSSPAHGSGSPVCARRAHWESIYASITLAAAMSNHNT